VSDELGKTWKAEVANYFKVLSQNLSSRTEKNLEKSQAKTADLLDEM
jgi:hypothetical protein